MECEVTFLDSFFFKLMSAIASSFSVLTMKTYDAHPIAYIII